MAQTGYTPILIYSSSTAAASPVAGNLTNSTLGSELAINITDGKLFYKDNANAIQVIGWKTVPTTAGGTGLTSYTAGDLLYYASGTALTKLAIGTSGRYLSSSGSAPQWTAPAALTKTDDTNVTLTLGGSASTALLNAASLTLGWTGTLATSRGGTGLSSFTSNGILYASSTSALATSSNLTWNGATLYANVATGTSRIQLVTQDLGGINFLIDVNSAACEIGSPNGVPVLFKTGGVDRGRFDTSGNLKVENGNFIVGTSGKGIDFSATPGTGTSELLADYEEGTWTPTLAGGTTAGSYTLNSVNAYYTRIGRQVIINARFDVTVNSAGTGGAKFGGLPFTKSASQFVTGSLITSSVTYAANIIDLSVQGWTSGASTEFSIAGTRSGTTPSDLDVTGIVTGSIFYMTFTYFV